MLGLEPEGLKMNDEFTTYTSCTDYYLQLYLGDSPLH